MAEMFTRKRRMALPSIVLLLAFVVGLGFFAGNLVDANMARHDVWHKCSYVTKADPDCGWNTQELYPWQVALIAAAIAVTSGLGALAHWKRFRVSITIAAAVGALVLLLLSGVAAATSSDLSTNAFIAPAALVCGLAVFAFAMRWDLADPARVTQKADIAFWLHLLAAPLIAHPLFYWMGVTQGGSIGTGAALGVLAIYLLFAIVALAIDRRALLVSALAYVLGALAQLFRDYGNVEVTIALTALVIGSALLALSAFWGPIRLAVTARLPETLRQRLPHMPKA
jgi:ABC-type multidrug transport system permease subunit